MAHPAWTIALPAAALLVGGCVESDWIDQEVPDGTTTGVTPSDGPSSTVTSTTDPAGDDDGWDDSSDFIVEPDCGDCGSQCDLWAQDCREGNKCTLDASREYQFCTPLADHPKQPGEPCTVFDPDTGHDDCGPRAFCWDATADTQGMCVELCDGGEANPTCNEPDEVCAWLTKSIPVCLPVCSPLAQDCPPGCACHWLSEDFACVPDASGPDLGVFPDPCQFINACDPGYACVSAEGVAECEDRRCCSPYCDTTLPNTCPGDGQECLAWYEEGQAPNGYETVGVCFVPLDSP